MGETTILQPSNALAGSRDPAGALRDPLRGPRFDEGGLNDERTAGSSSLADDAEGI